MSMPNEPIPLCVAEPTTFWPWLPWADFSRLPDKDEVLVIVPIAGFADWGLGRPFDAEETVLMPVLAEAVRRRSEKVRLLVVPPLRFVAGPGPRTAFAVDAPTAIAFINEVCASVKEAGFRRIVLFNASPWNEEIVDAAARDLRIERNLQMFCVNLSALGLDFRPDRAKSRANLQALLTSLLGREPEGTSNLIGSTTPASDALPAQAVPDGTTVLVDASIHLASLLEEIAARPPLARGGALIPMMTP